MDFWDIASIVFICTAVNHLGLVADVESVIKREIPVVNCVRCLTFWAVLGYGLGCEIFFTTTDHFEHILEMLAISFLSAWAAIWLDLCMGAIDKLYSKIYDTLYSATDTADTDTLGAGDSVPDMPEGEGCDGIATNGTSGTEEDCKEAAEEEKW